MEELCSWALKAFVVGMFGALGAAVATSAVSGIKYLWEKRKLRLEATRALAGQVHRASAKLSVESRVEANLEKVRAENFNFKVVRAIRKKLRERKNGLEN
jgi:hypothetical protein